jgi:hypothetical protein
MSLEVDPRVREYDATIISILHVTCRGRPRDDESKTRYSRLQEATILRFGGTLEAKKVPKQATLDTS